MTALFFGDSGSALFGIWSPPEGEDRGHGVLICPPIGQEHVRAHWALRQVSAALARTGFHTLRFDWFGVGDSAGTLREATLARWQQDLADAAQELRDTAGIDRISLVGLRVGASVVALGAQTVRPSAIVLWDPVVDGRAYVQEQRALTQAILTDPRRYWSAEPDRRTSRPGELVGFEHGESLVAELAALGGADGALDVQSLPQVPLCLHGSADDDAADVLGTRLRETHPEVEVHRSALSSGWNDPADIERLLLPGDSLRTVTSFLEARAA